MEVMCRILQVARSGFYAWYRRRESARQRQNAWLLAHIRACYRASHTSTKHRLPSGIHPVQLEHMLRQIDPQCRDVHNSPSLLPDYECVSRLPPPISPRMWHVWEERWVHFISTIRVMSSLVCRFVQGQGENEIGTYI